MSIAESLSTVESMDPNTAQHAASHPDHSVWVGASAGTGKTKVLTDRVLRLLLPREDNRPGTPPNRIVCLTFTKAAANEMAVRLNTMLGSWAVMDIDHSEDKKSLRYTLRQLLGYDPEDRHINAAKRLFADVIDCPGGIQIMNIHSFCNSLLGRFPVEAGLPPNFSTIEEAESAELMRSAQSQVIEYSQNPEQAGAPIANAVNAVITELDEKTFSTLVKQICGERQQMVGLLQQYGSFDNVYAALCDFYNVAQNLSNHDVVNAFCIADKFDSVGLKHVAELLSEDKGKKAQERAPVMLDWLAASQEERVKLYEVYKTAFLTQKGSIHQQSFPPKSVEKKYPQAIEILYKEAERILDAENTIKASKSAAMTRDLLIIGHSVLEKYSKLKEQRGGLDFDDLIARTMELLTGRTQHFLSLDEKEQVNVMPWVLYKLDQGIDHVLVDEAQDTNPEQWRIIEALSDEFFAGLSARDDVLRTSFTVGDIKQSIYGFQRAAPDEFKRMQKVMDEKITHAGLVNENVALDVSFRSTKSVLQIVDSVFQSPALSKAVGEDEIHHKAFRQGQAGLVELWPVFETPKSDQRDFWDPPVSVQSHSNGSSELANYIADNIRNKLDRKEFLPSCNRAIEPGDFMILVRSRSSFVEQLVRALKAQNIPVSGADRMMLTDQLAVQDLMSLARFCLLPDDDLTLAEVLKSPFVGWDDDELFSLSYNRKGTLWQEICNFDYKKLTRIEKEIEIVSEDKLAAVHDYLSRMIGRVKVMGAYEFLSYILTQRCPTDDISGMRAICARLGQDAVDPVDELLNSALSFGYDHIDHVQLFLDYQEQTNAEIKREMEDTTNQVRIMTIHGSKGLQSPIVILPDTLKDGAAKKTGRFLWPDKTGLTTPIYAARENDDPEQYINIRQACQDYDDEEYYRLLYVAMTRAADRLYIGGHTKTKPKEQSWYYMIRQAMEMNPDVQELEGGVLRLENRQTEKPDKEDIKTGRQNQGREMPDWVFEKAKEEPFPPKPLVPSRPLEDDDIALAPLKAVDGNRFLRGNVTHKLLEFLPDVAPENRKNAAARYVQKNAADISGEAQDSIVSEVMKILDEYGNFFKAGSMAEVPITGLMPDNRIISGQIDRLVIDKDNIWILDYKTNRPPPHDEKDIPAIYRDQLTAYHDAIAAIYTEHKIHCAILWTDGPRLMRVTI